MQIQGNTNAVRKYARTLTPSEKQYCEDYHSREENGIYTGVSPRRQSELRTAVEKLEHLS